MPIYVNVVERVDEPTALRKLRERYAVGDLTLAELDELTGRVLSGDHAAAWPPPSG